MNISDKDKTDIEGAAWKLYGEGYSRGYKTAKQLIRTIAECAKTNEGLQIAYAVLEKIQTTYEMDESEDFHFCVDKDSEKEEVIFASYYPGDVW